MQLVEGHKEPFFVRHRRLPLYIICAIEAWNIYYLATQPFNWLRLINPIVVPAILCFAAYYSMGHPRNWWRQYFGQRVQIPYNLHDELYPEDKDLDAAIEDWLKQSGIKSYYRHWSHNYQFLRKKDAVQFKLTWG